MFGNITSSIVEILESAGLSAGRAYPSQPIERDGACFIRAAVESVRQSESGFSGFLGAETDDEGGSREIYGMICDVNVALDIYAPMKSENGADKCEAAIDDIIFALGECEGLQIRELSCSRARPDSATEMFLCPCRANVSVLLTAAAREEAVQFSDFILKGEIKK